MTHDRVICYAIVTIVDDSITGERALIDTATQSTNIIYCKQCGKPITPIPGHRPRQYCNNTCKQTAYRQRKERHGVTIVDDSGQQQRRIAELEQEVQRLTERLNVEERYRTDVQVRHFKTWLKTHPQPIDTDFSRRVLADSRLPHHASRAMYAARLRQYGYSAEDMELFQEAWKAMLFTQS